MLNMHKSKSAENLGKKIGIDVDKYSNDKTSQELSEFLELSTSFTSTLLIYILISLSIFLSISVGFIIIYQTYLFPILFFLSSIPVIIGVGIIGFNKAMNDTVSGINGVLHYSVEIIGEIYGIAQNKKEGKDIKVSEVGGFVAYYIILPSVKLWMNRRFFRGMIYNLLEKGLININSLLEKQNSIIEKAMDTDITDTDLETEQNSDAKIIKLKSITSNTKNISLKLVAGISFVSRLISIISIVLGCILLSIVIILNLIF